MYTSPCVSIDILMHTSRLKLRSSNAYQRIEIPNERFLLRGNTDELLFSHCPILLRDDCECLIKE